MTPIDRDEVARRAAIIKAEGLKRGRCIRKYELAELFRARECGVERERWERDGDEDRNTVV